jgi:hypothetical protein
MDKEEKVKMDFSTKEDIRSKTEFLYGRKTPFKYVRTGNSYELYSAVWNCKTFRKGFTPEDLQFIKKVKKYARNPEIIMKYIDKDYQEKPIEYIKVNENVKVGDRFDNVICVDINSAYWVTAFQLGIIDEPTYQKGKKIDKIVRLASLGSLAKKTETFEFDGERMIQKTVERSHETENLWFAICDKVGSLMSNLSKKIGNDFITYWVDGIYFVNTPENYKIITETFKAEGYACKIEQVSSIVFNESDFVITGATEVDKKVFCYAIDRNKAKVKGAITRYLEERDLVAKANKIMNTREPRKITRK